MSEWDKHWEGVEFDDIFKMFKPAGFLKQVKAEGDKLQRDNKNLAYEITIHKKRILKQEQKLKEIRVITEDHNQTVYSLKHRIWEVLGKCL